MNKKLFPTRLHEKYQIDEREHAAAILKSDFPNEFRDIVECLDSFCLKKSAIAVPGGRRSKVSEEIDDFLSQRGWKEQSFDTKFLVDGNEIASPTHKIDNFKNRVGVEVEWNSKTEFYDRDLNNFRLLRMLSVSDVSMRTFEFQDI